MTAAIDREVHFGLVELDLLATHAGVPFPFPLRVPSFGRFAGEREVLLAEAGAALRARGLATGIEPTGVASVLVTALREYRGAVDVVVVEAGTVTGAVAMVYRNRAVVCRQSPCDERAGFVRVRPVPAAAVAAELAALVPEVRAAAAMPVTLPPGVVGEAVRLPDTPAGRHRVRELVAERGGDETAVDRLIDLLPAVAGRGQLGAVRRCGTTVDRSCEVSWLDGPQGRVRVDRDRGGWLSVNPLRHADLVRMLGAAAAAARV